MSDPHKSAAAWRFRFSIEATADRSVHLSEAERLLADIVILVEERGLQIGGGFLPLDEKGKPL